MCVFMAPMLIKIRFQIASTAGWYFFTLLNAYYGGALTMFFTSEVALPFDNVREVREQFPTRSFRLKIGLFTRGSRKGR